MNITQLTQALDIIRSYAPEAELEVLNEGEVFFVPLSFIEFVDSTSYEQASRLDDLGWRRMQNGTAEGTGWKADWGEE